MALVNSCSKILDRLVSHRFSSSCTFRLSMYISLNMNSMLQVSFRTLATQSELSNIPTQRELDTGNSTWPALLELLLP